MGIRDLFSSRTSRKAGDKIQRGVSLFVVGLLFSMIVVSVLLALSSRDGGAGVTAFLLFVAAAAVGAGLGFVFGLPRARAAEASEGGGVQPGTFYLTNSNLIKVSDWLTTIVIGLGLVNLGKVVPSMRSLARALHDPLGGTAYAGAVGISVLVIGLMAGFLLNYLWTSIRVRELLEEAERQNQQTMPDLSNQTLGEAKQAASRSNVTLLVPEGAPDGALVARQAVPAGTSVPTGTAVAISTVEPPGLRP
ncbi:PASTA domain-containing protein [Paractinoplanes lichenicola]|uniref:PASTA domain-containing protein n=1 Tax=Paractinoplanes lichenicola TaxID=2802976 RepID=A0ABS1VSV0_9ACTN|nr:PASTA domain-containing protein [Actinoplanes lichenicola]MBL7257527.1 PASTA domain-containing protein [Actinoplanes lichenicola]